MADSNITKRALAETLKELMQQQPFGKISVGGICEKCGMNRKSFYYHFRDKYDLVGWIFHTEFIESVNLHEYDSAGQFLLQIVRYLYDERVFYRHALKIEGQNAFSGYFRQTLRPFLTAFARDIFIRTDDPDFYTGIVCDAFIAAITTWLADKNPVPPDELGRNLQKILLRFSRNFLEDHAESQ